MKLLFNLMGSFLLLLTFATSQAINLSPVSCANFNASYDNNSHIATIKLLNNCDYNLDFSNALLTFAGANPGAAPWGNEPNYMSWIGWNVCTSNTANCNNSNGFQFTKNTNNSWQYVQLHPGDTYIYEFNSNAVPTNMALYLATVPPAQTGEIDVTFQKPNNTQLSSPEVKIIGPNNYQQTLTGYWNQPLQIKFLAYGNYNITALPIVSNQITYNGAIEPTNPIAVANDKPVAVTATYAQQATGNLSIVIASAPVIGLPAPQISIQNITTNQPVAVPAAQWGTTLQVNNLIAGNSYAISSNSITYQNNNYTPVIQPQTVTISANGSVFSSLQYEAQSQPITTYGQVNIKTAGIPGSKINNVNVTFANTQNQNTIIKSVALDNESNLEIPVGTYQVTSASVNINGQNYIANDINPNPIVVAQSQTANLTINYSQQNNAGNFYAPYIDTAQLGTNVLVQNLQTLATTPGLKHITLAFVLASNGANGDACSADFYGIPWNVNLQQEINAYKQAGGDAIASFGGANGPYVEDNSNCKTNGSYDKQKLAQAYSYIVSNYGINKLDFDVEGYYIGLTDQVHARNQALALLQQSNPSIQVSYTLAVLPSGLPQSAIQLLQDAINSGVNITRVNLMAMDYGSIAPPNQMGQNAIDAAQATFNQLKALYPQKNSAQLWNMIGITPMIGMNDVAPEVFTQTDANLLVNFAKQQGVGLLAAWSLTRDQACPNNGNYVSPSCSGVTQQAYEFSNIFNTLN